MRLIDHVASAACDECAGKSTTGGQSASALQAPAELLALLRTRGVELTCGGERLRIETRGGALEPALIELVRTHNAELVALLQAENADLAKRELHRAPLTRNQRKLWLLSRMHPESSAYNVPYAFAWEGGLLVASLQASLRDLVCRHDALRMRIVERGDEALLEVAEPDSFNAEFVDLTDAPDTIEERLAQEAARPFNLAGDRLFRAVLFRLAPTRHVLLLCAHHIVVDGASLEIMLNELSELYAAHVRGLSRSLPALPSSFLRHAQREREPAESTQLEREVSELAAQLRGVEPLSLPSDRPRPASFSFRGDSCSWSLSRELSRTIKSLAGQLSTTPHVVLLAAYELLLARYSGQRDFAVGIPAAGRELENEGLVGYFARTLVVRANLHGVATFAELVTRVKERRLSALQYERVPFDRLVERLGAGGDRSRTPIFQTLFSLEDNQPHSDQISGARWERRWVGNGGAKTDLTFVLGYEDERFSGALEYSTDLFERETIDRLLKNFETLLESVASEPHAPMLRANMVHADELAALARVNDTARELPKVGGFHELIRAQAQRGPDRVAIVDQHGSMSYGELDRSSDTWAARLAALGVGRGARVGVALGRSRRVLEVNLGILKSGAAYVPLDTTFPRERLAFMAEDAGLACIVAERAAVEKLPAEGPRVLVMEELEQAPVPAERHVSTRVAHQPSDAAYVIYTSGSTGQPKGVEVLHGGVINLLTSMAHVPGLSADDRAMAVSTFSFDMCIAELYLPLTVGACTIIAPRTCAADGELLSRTIDEYGATFVQATPTTFKLLVEAGLPKQRFKAVAGGEAFPGQLARALAPSCPEIWNGYGPTETTVYATFYRVDDPDRPVLIGRPVANTRLYVLDAEGQPVPFGVSGELYIGGAGVSGGYLNRPDLTEARFLSDPFSEQPGARMYRTGDLVRMQREGVQYVGRTDNQVKLRGYRIELGEIESVLAAQPSVEHAAVLVRELGPNDQRLLAYVTGKRGATISASELRAELAKHLPSYMVPKLIVPLPTMPMTASGKVDTALLPDPRAALTEERDVSVPLPECATERALLEIWQSVLGTREVGVTDDFFAVGGHSLLAVQLVKKINQTFHTRMSLGVIFEAPTIQAQARRIDRGEHGGGVSIVLLHPGGRGEPLFCICGINLYQALANEVGGERPVYGLFLPVEGELFEASTVELDARDMARQYLEAIRAVQPRGPYHLLGVSFGGALAYEIARQLRQSGDEVRLVALLDTILPSSVTPSRLRQAAKDAVSWARSRLGPLAKALDVTPWTDGAQQAPKLVLESAHERSATEDVSAALTERMRRYRQALSSYERTMEPYDGDVVLVRALEQFRQLPGCAPDYGWSQHVRGALEVWDSPGDHLDILTMPHVRTLAERLAAKLMQPVRELLAARAS